MELFITSYSSHTKQLPLRFWKLFQKIPPKWFISPPPPLSPSPSHSPLFPQQEMSITVRASHSAVIKGNDLFSTCRAVTHVWEATETLCVCVAVCVCCSVCYSVCVCLQCACVFMQRRHTMHRFLTPPPCSLCTSKI